MRRLLSLSAWRVVRSAASLMVISRRRRCGGFTTRLRPIVLQRALGLRILRLILTGTPFFRKPKSTEFRDMTTPNQPDRANRRQPLGFRESVGKAGVRGFTAAVAHPGRSTQYAGIYTGLVALLMIIVGCSSERHSAKPVISSEHAILKALARRDRNAVHVALW